MWHSSISGTARAAALNARSDFSVVSDRRTSAKATCSRPSFAGSELGRPDWAGSKPSKENPVDSRRESTPYDYAGESFAQIGLMRSGPDLSNVGTRIVRRAAASEESLSPEQWLFRHLHDPRSKPEAYWSTCPSQGHLFKERFITGQGSGDAIPAELPEGVEIVPGDDARALVSYLLSLRKDDSVPAVINYSRRAPSAE